MTEATYRQESLWKRALIVQSRVTYALIMREIRTMYGRSKLGYLWVIIMTVFNIMIFWGIRIFFGRVTHYGMSMPMFLLCGFTIWFCFNEALQAGMHAIRANQGLLFYPQVQAFDLFLSRLLLIGSTKIFTFVIIAFLIHACGEEVVMPSLSYILFALPTALLMGMGFGAIFCAVDKYIASTPNLVSMVMRIMFFTSGIFFSLDNMPAHVKDIIQWNPILQLIELSRSSFSTVFFADYVSYWYLISLTLVALVVGLIAERMTRHKMKDLV